MNFIDSITEKEITLDGEKYPLLHLGDFFKLDLLRKQLKKSIQTRNKKEFNETLIKIVELQTKKIYIPKNFIQTILNVQLILSNNVITADARFMKVREKNENEEKLSYDYDGRVLATWINKFATTYHWSFDQIINLPLNLAVYLYQEMMVTDHREKEWQYSLTELAYKYDKNTETSHFVPLEKPEWMKPTAKEVKPIPISKIPVAHLPQGLVIDLAGMGVMSRDEQNPKLVPDQEALNKQAAYDKQQKK